MDACWAGRVEGWAELGAWRGTVCPCPGQHNSWEECQEEAQKECCAYGCWQETLDRAWLPEESPEEAGWDFPSPAPHLLCLLVQPTLISWGIHRSPAPYMGSRTVEVSGATVALCLMLAPGTHTSDRAGKGGPFGDGGEGVSAAPA